MKFVISGMFSLICMVQANAKVIISFQPHITAKAQFLGDLIMIKNDQYHLMRLPLDSAPRSGERITKEHMMQWITNKTGRLDYQWNGKHSAQIQQITQTSGKELINKAQTALENHLKKKYDVVELRQKGKVADSEYSLADLNVEVTTFFPPAKRICVRLKHATQTIPIWFEVKAYQSVWVASSAIKARTPLRSTDFHRKSHNIAGMQDEPLTILPASSWLIKSMNTHHILTLKDIADIPDVHKGQRVEVTILNHGISVIFKGIAQHDAYINQLIRLKNPASAKYFIAKVTAPDKAVMSS